MHLTLKKEATRPPGMNSLQQQARFDDFVTEFNTERPHEALAMKCPAEVYTASTRPYDGTLRLRGFCVGVKPLRASLANHCIQILFLPHFSHKPA
jgi:hypothetical protein